jgi:hypothetical protein
LQQQLLGLLVGRKGDPVPRLLLTEFAAAASTESLVDAEPAPGVLKFEVNCSPSPWPIPPGNNNTYVSGNGRREMKELDLPAASGSGDEHTVNKTDSSECVIAVKPHGTDTIGGKNEAYPIVVAQESITFADRAPGKWALK